MLRFRIVSDENVLSDSLDLFGRMKMPALLSMPLLTYPISVWHWHLRRNFAHSSGVRKLESLGNRTALFA